MKPTPTLGLIFVLRNPLTNEMTQMLLYLSLSFQTPFPSLTFMCFYEDPVSGQWHFLSAILLASSTTGSADQPHPTIHSNQPSRGGQGHEKKTFENMKT